MVAASHPPPRAASARPITGEGVWLEVRLRPPAAPVPALFLDRDGVIAADDGFLADPAAVALVPGAAALIVAANQAGVPVAVVTNQSGIDRGLFGWDAFAAVERRIEELLAGAGARIDALAACPFHPDFTPGYGPRQARWRKPRPGLIEALGAALNADLARSWLIGDAARDIEAARAAGLAGAIRLGAADSDGGSGGMEVIAAADMDAARGLLRGRLLPGCAGE